MKRRQVQQHTFDSIVRESIDEFCLSTEEAIQDAIDQLKKAGITDFSNISTTPSQSHSTPTNDGKDVDNELNPADSFIESLRTAIESNDLPSIEQSVINILKSLSPSYYGEIPFSLINSALSLSISTKVISSICVIIVKLCSKDDANRSRFTTETQIHTPLKLLLKQHYKRDNDNDNVQYALLSAMAALQRRNERMKRLLASEDSPMHVLTIFRTCGQLALDDNISCDLFCIAGIVIEQWLASVENDIDPRIGVAEAFTRARILSGEHTVTESGLRPLPSTDPNLMMSLVSLVSKFCEFESTEDEDDDELGKRRMKCIKQCLSVTKASAQSDEMCKQLFNGKIINNCIIPTFKCYPKDEYIATLCIQTLSKLSQRDDSKTEIYTSCVSTVTNIVKPFINTNEKVVLAYLWLIARVCLRRPDIAREVAKNGLGDQVVYIMKEYLNNLAIADAGCQVLRNVCSRDLDARNRIRQGDSSDGESCVGVAETVVRQIMQKWGKQCDIAYYALQEMDVLADDEMRWDGRYGHKPSATSTFTTSTALANS